MPDIENEAFNPLKMTDKQRIERLEHLVDVLANHQAGLGTSLIRAHRQIVAMQADLLAADIATTDGKPSSIQVDTAPLILPSGHPMRKH